MTEIAAKNHVPSAPYPSAVYLRLDGAELARIIDNLRVAGASLDAGVRKMIDRKDGLGDLGSAAGMIDSTIRRLVKLVPCAEIALPSETPHHDPHDAPQDKP